MSPRPLAEIAAEMASLGSGDLEADHCRADDLLIEAIDRLSSYATETVDEGETAPLIVAFNHLEKWYA